MISRSLCSTGLSHDVCLICCRRSVLSESEIVWSTSSKLCAKSSVLAAGRWAQLKNICYNIFPLLWTLHSSCTFVSLATSSGACWVPCQNISDQWTLMAYDKSPANCLFLRYMPQNDHTWTQFPKAPFWSDHIESLVLGKHRPPADHSVSVLLPDLIEMHHTAMLPPLVTQYCSTSDSLVKCL